MSDEKYCSAARFCFSGEKRLDRVHLAGIDFTLRNSPTSQRYLIETMGGGGAFLDYNRDGRLDIFLVNSGCHKFSVKCPPGKNALWNG